MAKLPPDDNKVDPEVAAPCLIKFTKPGGRRPTEPPNIAIPPVNPGGTGPPGGGGGRTGFTGPGGRPLGYCKCFLHPSTLVRQPINPPSKNYRSCEKWTYTWIQTCEETNAAGQYKGRPGLAGQDPFGGIQDLLQVQQIRCNHPGPGFGVFIQPCTWTGWPGGIGKNCRDPLLGTCTIPCQTVTLVFIVCQLRDITPPGTVPPQGPTPPPPAGPVTPGPRGPTGPITPGGIGGYCDCTYKSGPGPIVAGPHDAQGCQTFSAVFKYRCGVFAEGEERDPDPAKEFERRKKSEGFLNVDLRKTGTVADRCTKTNCGGRCLNTTVSWKKCPDPTGPITPGGHAWGWQCDTDSSEPIGCTGPGETTLEYGEKRKCVPCTPSTPRYLCKPLDDCRKACKDIPPKCRKDTPVGGFEVEEEGLVQLPEGDDSMWGSRNNPGRSTRVKPNPQTYSLDVESKSGNTPFIKNTIIPYIPAPYNRDYVFHNWTDIKMLSKATLTSLKSGGDENNIFRVGEINKVLNDCLIPFNTINKNIYNDKTISIFVNYGQTLVDQSLSNETLKALKLVEKSNLISLNLSQDLREVIYSSVISGNVDLYSPQLLREISEVGESVLGSTIPDITNDNSLNFANALTYITRNLNSLYPKSYTTNGDDSRFAAHWLALPPEYKLALGVTPRVGDPVGIAVSLNFNFPVYERDGTKRTVKEFLDFVNVLDREGPTERVVPLKSNRSNLYTLDRSKESRVLGLIGASQDKSTAIFTVYSGGDLDKISSIETNESPVTLKESYLLKIDLDSIKIGGVTDAGLTGNFMKSYTATYDTSWVAGDDVEDFDKVINLSPKPVCGPNWVVYLPQDSWWAYFVDPEASNFSLSATFNCLDVDGYLPGMPDAVVGSQIPYTLLLVPTKDKVYKNPFNGTSVYTSRSTSFTTTVSPFTESEIYTKPTKDTTQINLQGQHDDFAMKFAKDFSESDLMAASVTDAADYTTCASDFGKCIIRINDLKSRYNLKFEGTDTLTQFDLYKGFSLNQLLKLLSIDISDVFTITGVSILLNKTRDRETPNSFITEDRLLPGKTPNTTNYIGSEIFPHILYFPPEYNYYN